MDDQELSELRAGLSEWSDATHGILGVKFVGNVRDAQVQVEMVDKIHGSSVEANGRTRFPWIDHGFAKLATIEVVHSSWSGGPGAQLTLKSRTVQRDSAHEMGHVLGIARHTIKPGTIMFRVPAADMPTILDVNTIKTKYCDWF